MGIPKRVFSLFACVLVLFVFNTFILCLLSWLPSGLAAAKDTFYRKVVLYLVVNTKLVDNMSVTCLVL